MTLDSTPRRDGIRSTAWLRHCGRRLCVLLVIVSGGLTNGAFAQRALSPVPGPDGFLALPGKISAQALEGLRATAMDPSVGAAYDVDVHDGMLILRHTGAEVARGVLSETGTAREACYGFERDDGRLKQSYLLCQPRADMVVTARPRAADGYFASLKAGALYLKVMLLDRNYGTVESVYSAALLKPRK